MKINVEFDLSKDEDKYQYDVFLNGPSTIIALEELGIFLRGLEKHETEIFQTPEEAVSRIRQRYYQILEENKISLDF